MHNRQPHFLANSLCHFFVVAGQNLGGNTVLSKSLNGLFCRLFRRIQKCENTQKYHVRLVLDTERGAYGRVIFARKILTRKREHSKSALIEAAYHVRDACAHIIGERVYLAFVFY